MRRPSRRISRLLGFTVVPVSLVATGLFVTASSYSVFSATTTSPQNTFTSGSVTLGNDSSGAQSTSTASALFNVGPVTPTSYPTTGSGLSKCITIQSSGTLPATTKLYAANVAHTATGYTGVDLDKYLFVKIETGSATSTAGGACTGWNTTATIYGGASSTYSLYNFETAYPGSSQALALTWTPGASGSPQSQAYRVTVWTDQTNMSNNQQNSIAKTDFVWEANNS